MLVKEVLQKLENTTWIKIANENFGTLFDDEIFTLKYSDLDLDVILNANCDVKISNGKVILWID